MRKRSNEYWKKRSIARMASSEKQSIAYLKNLQRIYKESLKATTRDLRDAYAAYYKKSDKIFDIPQLDNAATQGDIKRFLAAMKKAGLSTYLPDNYNGRMSRLGMLEAQIWGEVKRAAIQEGSVTKDLYREVYENSYYRTGYDYAKGTGTNLAFSTLDAQTFDAVMSQKFVGSDFSERVWNNTDRLAGELKEILGVAIATGQSEEKTVRLLRDRFNVAMKRAARLVRTETAYFHNRAELDAYEEMGFDKYQVIGTLDMRCCTECRKLDSKVFNVKDRKYGENAPPFHPYCRCTEIAYFGKDFEPKTRTARDPGTGRNYQIENMNYEEWRKRFLVDPDAGVKQTSLMMGNIHPIIGDGVMGDLGIRRGHPMPHDKAIKGTNPKYKSNSNYARNCQRCVPVYELRRRGYDVTAAPKPPYNFMGRSDIAFVDKRTGDFPKFSPLRTSRNEMELDMASYPNNSRFAVRIGRGRGKPGHVFVAEKIDDKIFYSDPQIGKTNTLSVFRTAKNMQFFRMDNLQINNNKLLMRSIIERDD